MAIKPPLFDAILDTDGHVSKIWLKYFQDLNSASSGPFQPLDADLTAIAALTGTGLARRTAPDTWVLDSAAYQPLDGDLTAIAALSGTGIARKTGPDAWTLDSAAGYVPSTRRIDTTSPLTGGGDLSADLTLAVTSSALSGTANQVLLSGSGAGVLLGSVPIALSLPQDIHTGASPTFAGETLSGLAGTGTRLVTSTSTGAFGNATTIAGNYTFSGTIAASNLSGTNTGDQTITLTGDVTGTGTGSFATTIGSNKVTDAMLRQGAGLSVIGRSANTTGNEADITAGTDAFVLRRSGATLGFGTIGDASISALAWSKLTGTPTTLSGYSITDATPSARTISTTAPLTGGGDLSANRTFAITSATLAGTTNQVSLSASGVGVLLGSGNITLSLPQNIHTAATPQFADLGLGLAPTLGMLHLGQSTINTTALYIADQPSTAYTAIATGVGLVQFGGDTTVSRTNSGGTVALKSINNANAASSDAQILVEVGGSSAGNAYYRSGRNGGANTWTFGAVNSSGDFVLSASSAFNSNNRVSVTAAGVVTIVNLAGTGTRITTSTSTGAQGNATTIAGDYTFSGIISIASQVNIGDANFHLITSHVIGTPDSLSVGTAFSCPSIFATGSFAGVPTSTGNANLTLSADHYLIRCNNSVNITLTLPSASDASGREYIVTSDFHASATVTIGTAVFVNSSTGRAGSGSWVFTNATSNYISIVSNGNEWIMFGYG